MTDERSAKYQWSRLVWNIRAIIAARRLEKAADMLLAMGEPALAISALNLSLELPADYKSRKSLRDRFAPRSQPIPEGGEK